MPADEFAGWLARSHDKAGLLMGAPPMATLRPRASELQT
jgi:hypothetical protein